MKLVIKQNPTTICFKDVNPGQVFAHEAEIYMKLDVAYQTHDEYGYMEANYSAVHLETGELCHFDLFEEVQLPVKIVHMEITF